MTEANNCCGTTCDKAALLKETEGRESIIRAQQQRISDLLRERDEFERAYRSLFNKRSLRVHDLQKSLWKEMDKRCFPGAYMQIVCDKILEYGCAEVADLKKQIERITRDRDEALVALTAERDEALATLEDRIINSDDTDPISASSAYFDLCSEHDIPLGGSLSSFINEIIKQRDEALAYGERLRTVARGLIADCEEAVFNDENVFCVNQDVVSDLDEVTEEQPPAALAALKAQWQAEAIDYAISELSYCGCDGQAWVSELEQYAIKLRAQEAGDE